MAVADNLTIYWGVASGSSHAAFRRHCERMQLDIFDRRIALEDQLRVG